MMWSNEIPHRVMYWHIASPYKYLIYPMLVVSLGFFFYGVWQRFKFWREGTAEDRFNHWGERIKRFLVEIPFQTRVLKDRRGGIMHVLIFWSFLVLMLATAVVFVDVDFKVPIYNGVLYLVVTLAADLAGLFLMGGLGYAAYRRYIKKEARLENQWDDALALGLLSLIALTGFIMEAMRIRYTQDPWAVWSPVGFLFSLALPELGEKGQTRLYQGLWWFHAVAVFGFIGAVPYTKFFHIVTLPLNTFFMSLAPKGSLPRQDMEALMSDESAMENFNVGVSEVKHLTWKQRLDYDSCLRCGRCLEVCPAHQNQHPLAPRDLIQDLKKFAHAEFRKNGKKSPVTEGEDAATPEAEPPLLVGNAVTSDAIWECRTCRACMEVCPSHIEHVPQIMELRRGEVMMRGQIPQDGAVALKTLERVGNPFGPQEERQNWIREMKIPVIPAGEECEALLWIGCCTTFDQVKQKVAYHVLTILHEAGINAGVMGEDEFCCGDPARVLGDENLFQTMVKQQIERIQSRKFKYLVTQCPHCYNVFKNEYPQFGANFKVVHHTQLIHELIQAGRLELELPIPRTIVYHDPCYLGRYNDIYEAPRQILKSIKGINLVEMEHHHEKSRCCGAGGGHYWMDIPNGERLNVARIREATAANAEIVAVGCVFCLQMLNDSIKILDLDEKMAVLDVSELVIEAMGGIPEIMAQSVLRKLEGMAA